MALILPDKKKKTERRGLILPGTIKEEPVKTAERRLPPKKTLPQRKEGFVPKPKVSFFDTVKKYITPPEEVKKIREKAKPVTAVEREVKKRVSPGYIPTRREGPVFEVGAGLTESKKTTADRIIGEMLQPRQTFAERKTKEVVERAGRLTGDVVKMYGGIANTLTTEAANLENRVLESGLTPKIIKGQILTSRAVREGLEKATLSALNSEPAVKTIDLIARNSADLPLKGYALLKSMGANTYKESYQALMDEKNNPENSSFKKFGFDLQSTMGQTGLGVLLSLAAGRVNRRAGQTLGGAYWTALSADEQLQERGEVTSVGNIAIDVLGDKLLGDTIENVLKGKNSVVRDAMRAFQVEGGTEVGQSILKYSNDYKNAKTDAERDAIIKDTERYVTSGAILTEYLAGGLSGGGISIIATGGDRLLTVNTQELKNDVEKIDQALVEVQSAPNGQEKEDVIANLTKSKTLIEERIEKEPKKLPPKKVVVSKELETLAEKAKEYDSAEAFLEAAEQKAIEMDFATARAFQDEFKVEEGLEAQRDERIKKSIVEFYNKATGVEFTKKVVKDTKEGKREDLRLDNEKMIQRAIDTGFVEEGSGPTSPVTVFRAGTSDIKPGEHVTIQESNAGRYVGQREGAKVYSKEVPLQDLVKSEGLRTEFVYMPKKEVKKPEVAKPTKKVPTKEIKVPREQLPVVSKGKVKASRLEARVKGALDNLTEENIEKLGLSTYNVMNKKEQIREATKLVARDEQLAIDILEGKEEAPKGLLHNSIFIALQAKASTEANKELGLKLATLKSTRMGQEISILSEALEFSPVDVLSELVKIREETVEKTRGKKEKKRAAKEVKKSIKKPTKDDWSSFIDSITC